MGTTTFSGPIKAGTIKETTGTTLGVNIKNTGQVVMAQTTDFSTAGGAQTATVTDIVIPAASQIIDIVIDVPVAGANSTCVVGIGDTVGGNATFIYQFSNTVACGARRKYPTTEAGRALVWADVGTEKRLTVTTTGATNAGTIRFTVLYQQAIDL